MSIAENCLLLLQKKEWHELINILEDEKNCKELSTDPVFSILEKHLLSEIQRCESEENKNLILILTRIFQLHHISKTLSFSQDCFNRIVEYLFQQHPSEQYALLLPENEQAKDFLKRKNQERQKQAEMTVISSHLNIKVGNTGKLDHSKSIFNSLQEQELYLAAKEIFRNEIILPNTALSTLIDSKITNVLSDEQKNFFYNQH